MPSGPQTSTPLPVQHPAVAAMHPSLSDPHCHQPLPEGPLAEHSRFYQRLHRRYANDLPLLPPGVPVLATMEQAYDALCARGCDTGTALRVLRQLVMERLIQLDLSLIHI